MENIAFNLEINTHKSALQRFAFSFTKNSDDANDLVQDTFLKAMRYSSLFKEGTNLRAWLYTIMKNTFLNNYRVLTLRRNIIDTSEELMSHQLLNSSSWNSAEGTLTAEDINKAFRKIPPVYFIPFIKYFEGYKYHEIAEELCIPIGTVKTRIFMARKALQAKLVMYKHIN